MAIKTTPKLHKLKLAATIGSTALRHNGGIRTVACAPGFIASAGDGTNVHLWDPKTGERIRDLDGAARGLYSVAVSRDGRFVAAGGSDLQLWDSKTGKRRGFTAKPLVVACTFSFDGRELLYGNDRIPARIEVATGKPLPPLKGHQARVDAVAFSPDGRFALSGAGDHKVKLHDLTAKKPAVLSTWEGYSKSCGFTADSAAAWSVGFDHALLWSVSTGKELRKFKPGRRGAMSFDGSRLAVMGELEVQVFDVNTGKKVGEVPYVNGDTACFSPDGKSLILGSDGRGLGEGCAVNVFDLETWTRVLPSDEGHAGAVEAMAIPSKRPSMLVSLGVDRMLQLTDLASGRSIERFGPVEGEGRAIATAADGRSAVTTTDTSQLLAWDLESGVSRSLDVKEQGRSSVDVALSPDEKEIAWAPYLPPVVSVVDLAKRKTRLRLEGHKGQLCAVTFSLDGKLVLSAAADEKVIGWNRVDGARLFTLDCSGFVNAISTVPGTDLLVTGTTNGQLLAWRLSTQERVVLLASGSEVRSLAGTADGRVGVLRMASDWDHSVVEVWHVAKKKREAWADLTPMKMKARSLAVTPDGATLCIGTNSGQVLLLQR